jgi:hypothetical protein
VPASGRNAKRSRPPAKKPSGARPSRPAKSSHARPAKKPVAKPVPKKPSAPAKASTKSTSTPKAPAAPPVELSVPLPGGRRHVLSLSFLRDGDEFLARLETDAGHITELKNRSLDQLLTLVAGELEDLLT